MAIVEFTPGSARDMWRDAIGWLLGKVAFRVDKTLPDRLKGLVRKLD